MTTLCRMSDLPAYSCGCHTCSPDAVVQPETMPYETPQTPPELASPAPSRREAPSRPKLRGSTLLELLLSTPSVFHHLEGALEGHSTGESEKVTGSKTDEHPMPAQAQVVEHRHQLLHDLRYWVAQTSPPLQAARLQGLGDDVARMCAVLIDTLADLDDDDTEALHGTLEDWHAGARRLLDLPRLRGKLPLPVGCPSSNDLWVCEGTVWALLPADRGRPVGLRCDACGSRFDAAGLPGADQVTLGLSDAAALAGVTTRALQKRIRNGALEDVNPDDTGGAVVRLGDVLAAGTTLGLA